MLDRVKVILVDDDADFNYLIQKTISQNKELDFIGSAKDRAAGIELAKSSQPDIVLMDLNLSYELEGIEVAREIKLEIKTKILLLTCVEDRAEMIKASKESFASGYILKSNLPQSPNILNDTILETARTHTPLAHMIRELILKSLTKKERCVFDRIISAGKNIELDNKTFINQKTSIFRKLGVKNVRELLHVFKD